MMSAVAVYYRSQAKAFAQGPAFVFSTKQPPAVQFGKYHLDEILATARQFGRSDVETIAGRRFEPLLHDIGNVRRCADPSGSGQTGPEVQLTDCRLLSSDPLDELSADAAKLLCAQRVVRYRGASSS